MGFIRLPKQFCDDDILRLFMIAMNISLTQISITNFRVTHNLYILYTQKLKTRSKKPPNKKEYKNLNFILQLYTKTLHPSQFSHQ